MRAARSPPAAVPRAPPVAKLAHRLGFAGPEAFLAAFRKTTANVRACYLAIATRERS